MKHIPNIAAGLLGLAFVIFRYQSLSSFPRHVPTPPEGSPPYLFFGAIGPTGFLSFVKVCEIIGGILVALPKTRNLRTAGYRPDCRQHSRLSGLSYQERRLI